MPSSSVLVATMTQSLLLGERLLGLPPLRRAQRRVRHEGPDPQAAQSRCQFLDAGAAVAEDQALLAPVQPRDDRGRVREDADVSRW